MTTQGSRDPLEEGEDKATQMGTSSNREESMTESGKDAFGGKSAARNPASTTQSDGSSENPDVESGSGQQRSASSGTTSLGGESRNSESLRSPGGVEGESGES